LLPACLLASLVLTAAPGLAIAQAQNASSSTPQAGEATEDVQPTPLNEFAPESVRPTRSKSYDQGMTVAKVEVDGNRLIQQDSILNNMTIKPGSLYNRQALQQDLRRIYDMGYFTEKIKAVPVSTKQGIVLRIEVEENVPVTGVHIDGNTKISDEELESIFSDQTGLPQNIGQLNDSIAKIEKLYADKGYVLARVTAINDDPDGTINLSINEGVIDKVQFVGNRKTKDNVIKRSLVTKAGEIYNEKVVSEDLKRLFSSQAFSDVRRVISASPDNPDKYNLTIELDEKRTGAISLGGGVDTATGFFGSVGYSDPNFLGRGQNFNSVFSAGSGVLLRDSTTQARTRMYQFEVGWSTPSLYDTPNSLATSAYGRNLSSFNVPLAIERRIGSEVTWARPIERWKNTAFSLTARAENVSMREGASLASLADRFGVNQQQRDQMLKGGSFLTLTPTLAYDSRDNRFDPSSGWFNTVSFTGATGTASYGALTANVRKYFKLHDGVTLALNAQGGKSLLGDMPEFNMFRMGGTWSVRGFQEGGLGVGNGFLLSSAEIRTKVPFVSRFSQKVPMLDSLRTVFFADAGTLLGESQFNSLFDRAGFGYSVGMGIRLTVPGVGPLRVDYAIPLSSSNDNYIRRFNFGVGQKF
jgi:outer membrane protein insertion porin family